MGGSEGSAHETRQHTARETIAPQPAHGSHAHAPTPVPPQAVNYEYDDMDDGGSLRENDPPQHTTRILLHLSLFAPLLSLATAIYSLIIILLTAIASPYLLIHLRHKRTTSTIAANDDSSSSSSTQYTISSYLRHLLAPALSLQLRCIYSFPTSAGHSNILTLLLALLFIHPLLSIPLALAAWVAGAFCCFAAVLGNPASSSSSSSSRRRRRRQSSHEYDDKEVYTLEAGPTGNGSEDDYSQQIAILALRRLWQRALTFAL